MKHEALGPTERPPGYDAVSATIEAEKEHALTVFRQSSFEKRLQERIERTGSPRASRQRLALAAALGVVLLGVILVPRAAHRADHGGLVRAATVERALRATPFFSQPHAPVAQAEEDPDRAELAWSIQRIVSSMQRARIEERDLRRVVERALLAASGTHPVPVARDPWQDVPAADLSERIERLRRERDIERLLAVHGGIG